VKLNTGPFFIARNKTEINISIFCFYVQSARYFVNINERHAGLCCGDRQLRAIPIGKKKAIPKVASTPFFSLSLSLSLSLFLSRAIPQQYSI
jgi:hypothetical protein